MAEQVPFDPTAELLADSVKHNSILAVNDACPKHSALVVALREWYLQLWQRCARLVSVDLMAEDSPLSLQSPYVSVKIWRHQVASTGRGCQLAQLNSCAI